MRHFLLLVLLVGIWMGPAAAQPDQCPAEVDIILKAANDKCNQLGRNHICYGHNRVDAQISDDAESEFLEMGDVIGVNELIALQTYPLSSETEEWGIALLNIQASLPDTLPGQLVMLVVFGDTTLEPDTEAPEDYAGPMQAFYLQTGIGMSACKTVPPGGVLVQNPRQHPVTLLINQFELRIGSTALLSAEAGDELTISTLDGNVQVTVAGVTQDIPAGFTLSVMPNTPPGLPQQDPELEVALAALLPDALPEIFEPEGEQIGLFPCADAGGVDVATGSRLILRGGWWAYRIEGVINFAANTTPVLDIDGEPMSYQYRAGPLPWTEQGRAAFAMHWFWEIESISAGTHTVTWFVDGDNLVCQIRAG